VGKWRDHLSYNNLTRVAVGEERVYGAAGGGLFYYDTEEGSLHRMNKTTLLNDVGVGTFAYDPDSRWLLIAYTNSNIDLVKDDRTTNLSDIKRSNLSGNKSINNIRFHDRYAYLACGFGIVVIDLNRSEIKETYYIGPEGSPMNINDVAFTDSLIIAATDNGLLYAPQGHALLHVASTWTSDSTSLLAGQSVKQLEYHDGLLLALSQSDNDTTLYSAGDNLSFAPRLTDAISRIQIAEGLILVCQPHTIDLYDDQFQLRHQIGALDWLTMEAHDATLDGSGHLWVAHAWAGLVEMSLSDPASTFATHTPAGPVSDDVYRLKSYDHDLMVCPGGHTSTYAGSYLPANLYTYSVQENWRQLSDPNGLRGTMYDIIDVAVNPRDSKTRMAAAWGYGIVEIRDNEMTALYNEQNSDGTLTPYTSDSYSTLLTGAVAYDQEGNVWMTNSLQPYGLVCRTSDGSWRRYNTLSMVGSNDIDHILCDSITGYKYFWGRANKIFVHDGESRMAYIDPNYNAKLETHTVNALVQDHSGNLWLGTNKGVKVIYNAAQAFSNGGEGERAPVTCSNILYNENGINEYLLAYEGITCMAVDGANRKWVGTSGGGLYLLSANGLEQLAHFTASDSPLFSDKIVSLSILPWTGELFIGTDKGLQSYRATATYAYGEPQEEIYAFPNPVRPDYDGPIAIKGFSRNALIHITDAAGHTLFSTTAHGGQAVWDGRTNSGDRVASGVYFVFASSEDGSVRSVAKILVVR